MQDSPDMVIEVVFSTLFDFDQINVKENLAILVQSIETQENQTEFLNTSDVGGSQEAYV